MMDVKFYEFAIRPDLFARMNAGLGYTMDRCDYIAEFVGNGLTVGISALTLTPYAVYLDIYAPGFQLTRTALNKYMDFVFLHRPHALAIVSSANMHCQKFLHRIGFVCAGRLNGQFDGKNDELYFEISKDEWLKSVFFLKK